MFHPQYLKFQLQVLEFFAKEIPAAVENSIERSPNDLRVSLVYSFKVKKFGARNGFGRADVGQRFNFFEKLTKQSINTL